MNKNQRCSGRTRIESGYEGMYVCMADIARFRYVCSAGAGKSIRRWAVSVSRTRAMAFFCAGTASAGVIRGFRSVGGLSLG